MINRILYIDKLKGFAILLVVMGHLTDKSMVNEGSILNAIIFSIHMPLFMFLSGIFAFNRNITFKNLLYKRFLRLLMPYLFIGGGYVLMKDFGLQSALKSIGGYWFLPTLFLCTMSGYLIVTLNKYIYKKQGLYASEILIASIIWFIALALYFLLKRNNIMIPYFLNTIKMFPFFYIGSLYGRYEKIKAVINNNATLTISILLYILLFFYPVNIGFNVQGLFAIVICLQLFSKYDTSIPERLSVIGKNSLEIYVFHWFLLPDLTFMNNIQNPYNSNNLNNDNVILMFTVLSAIALIISVICIVISKVFKNSTVFSFLLFGITGKGNHN
ncbi:acyltransferase family protein [Bacteroides ilei]|uniref:acyltransferase family protein n=1 Tax=Bacteroides ilei TaxID=1907658 RepID=UPI000931CCAA|nr:acyltransferase family protein [Bacteroides ilei]